MSRRGRSSSSTSRCPQETDLRLQGGERGLQEAARLHQPSLLFYPLRRGFSQSAMRGQSSLLATGPAIRPTCPASNTRDARGLLALAEAGQVGCIDPMVGSQPLEGGDHVAAGDDQPVHQYHRGAPLGWAIPRGAGVHPQPADRGPDTLDLYRALDQRSSGRISFSKNRKKPPWSGPIWCM
jgi:hypothetical protein